MQLLTYVLRSTLLLLLLTISTINFAQFYGGGQGDGGYYNQQQQGDPYQKRNYGRQRNNGGYVDQGFSAIPFSPKVDLTLSYGYLTFGQTVSNSYYLASRYPYTFPSPNVGFSYGNFKYAGTGTLTTRVSVTRNIYVGLDLTYERVSANVYEGLSSIVLGQQTSDVYSIMPRIDANWYRSYLVKIYSTLSVGVAIVGSNTNVNSQGVQPMVTYVGFAGQISPIGVEVGRKLSGIAELGWGYRGLLNVGIRYRF